jgi:hypothetical protein
MKKIVVISGILIAILGSCSSEENQTEPQNIKKTVLNKTDSMDSSSIYRDSMHRDIDSLLISEPIKPKKD